MRFVQFIKDGMQFIGLELKQGGDLLNLNQADAKIPSDLRTFIEGGDNLWKAAGRLSSRCAHIFFPL